MNERFELISLSDSTEWPDEAVTKWINDNASVIQRDQNQRTLIFERDGNEFDRISSQHQPTRVLHWLKEAAHGRTWLEVLRFELRDEVGPRYELFHALLFRKHYDEALIHFEWLWNNALAQVPYWAGVRGVHLLGAVERIYEVHPLARQIVTKLRDETPRGHRDWVTLTRSLDDSQTLLDWLRTLTVEQADELHVETDDLLREFIIEHDAYAELGRLISDASRLLRERRERFDQLLASAPADVSREELDDTREHFSEIIRELVDVWERALLAIGRHDDADALRMTAREVE